MNEKLVSLEPILPIDYIGPGVLGIGAEPVESAENIVEPIGNSPPAQVSPMVPPEIEMSEEGERALIRYLDAELSACMMERSGLVSKFARLKQKYRLKYPEISKDWPIANSSQLDVPVIKTAVNTLAARIHQTIMAAEPLVSCRTDDMDFQDPIFAAENFLYEYDTEKLNIEGLLDDVVTETIMLGTSIVEVTNRMDKKAVVSYNGTEYEKTIETVFNGPWIWHIPIEDFYIRPAFQDAQTAPWCGKVVRLSWGQIKNMAVAGDLNPAKINDIYRLPEGEGDESKVVLSDEKQEEYVPSERDKFRLFELAVRWDFDGDGVEEEAIVYYHYESRTLLRRRFSGFVGGRRPWIPWRYIRIPHRFYGEGLAETLESLQEEISTIHNQRIDNATIANLRIILVNRLIRGLQPGDRLWSGKIIRVQDVKADVGTLQLGEIYPSTVENERISQEYVREVSGISEAATGQAQPVSRTTATAQLALLEELNRRFDKVVKGMRLSLAEMHKHLFDLFLQQGTNGLAETWLGAEQGQLLESFLALPHDLVHSKMKIRVLATKASVNREVEFQSSIAVMNLIVQLGQQMLQLTESLAPQATGVIAHELVSAVKPVFKKVMQYADAPSADQAISVLNVLERVLPPPESLGGPIGQAAGAQANQIQQSAIGVGGPVQPAATAGVTQPTADQQLSAILGAVRGNGRAGGGMATGSQNQ